MNLRKVLDHMLQSARDAFSTKKRGRGARTRRAGLSLAEQLAAVGIASFFLGGVLLSLPSVSNGAKVGKAKDDMANVANAVNQWVMETGAPAALATADLATITAAGFLNTPTLKDPWGSNYGLCGGTALDTPDSAQGCTLVKSATTGRLIAGTRIYVYSYGPDKAAGGGDDIFARIIDI